MCIYPSIHLEPSSPRLSNALGLNFPVCISPKVKKSLKKLCESKGSIFIQHWEGNADSLKYGNLYILIYHLDLCLKLFLQILQHLFQY